tara:strand:- start:4886 stop:6001 length:1116 start_codon:yes stop_codon:yes gene_type:complete
MRVCLVTDALEPNTGWGQYSAEIAIALRNLGVDIQIASPAEHCKYEQLRTNISESIPSFMYSHRHWARLMRSSFVPLRKATQNCDLVHCLVEPYLPVLSMVANGTPVVMSLVGTYCLPSKYPLLATQLFAWGCRRASAFTAISGYTARRFSAETGIEDVDVVPLGVDERRFWPNRNLPRVEPGLVVTVGMLKERKGVHVSLAAFAEVIKVLPEARYVIAGVDEDSPYPDQLRTLCQKLGICHAVDFIGEVNEEQKIDLYHRSSVFVAHFLSSETSFDGFGLVHLEANACGTPAIGTYDSGAEEAIENGVSGLLVNQNDVGATASAMLSIMQDQQKADSLSAGARRRAKSMTWDSTATKLISTYEKILGSCL